MTITAKSLESLEHELALAISKYSSGKLNYSQSKKLAEKSIQNIDFSNSALAHKGVNWYAKELVDMIDFEAFDSVKH